MRKIRVCELITEPGPAGAERCVYELATRLDPERFDVRVVVLRGGRAADTLAKAGVEVTVLGVRGTWDLARLCRLAGVLRGLAVDLVHTHDFQADLAGRPAARLVAVPHLVHTVHVAEGGFRPWQFAYARLLSGCCDRIVCVSPSARDYHLARSGLPKSRYTVIRRGIDADAFARSKGKRIQLRRLWGMAEDQPLVAFVGRLDHQEGIETLLSAMSHLAARGQATHLVIGGDGPERYIIENFIRHGEGGDHCRMLGFVNDVQAVLSAADIFAMPGRWGGFELVAAEAMAASLPVVGARSRGLRDIISDGETGVMIDPGDVFGLAARIEQLARDPELRRRLGSAAREHVRQEYSVKSMVAAHERLYVEVAAGALASRPQPIDAGWEE